MKPDNSLHKRSIKFYHDLLVKRKETNKKYTSQYLSASDFVTLNVSSEVSAPLTISTSFMIGGGFIKCMPITCKDKREELQDNIIVQKIKCKK